MILWLLMALSIVHGHAFYYHPGLMAHVAHVRGIQLRTDVAGYASVPSCSWIGHMVYARIGTAPWAPFQVLDCSDPTPRRQPNGSWESDRARHLRTGLVIEVDYATASRGHWVQDGRAPAAVWYP